MACLEALAETFGGLDLAGAGPVEPLTRSVLGSIHGPKTNPFSAYRVAETLDRLSIRRDAIDANLDAATGRRVDPR